MSGFTLQKLIIRVNAVKEVSGTGFVLTDLGSTNGTYVNKTSVKKTIVKSGDRIRIGKMTLSLLSAVTKEELLKADVDQDKSQEAMRLAQSEVLHGWPNALKCMPKEKRKLFFNRE